MKPSLISLSNVTHIGTLQPQDKGVRGPSYEGMGVSFSVNPAAWERIAKLGGQPWWEADVSKLSILDAHSFIDENEPQLVQWGLDKGLVQHRQCFRITWYDDELDSEVETLMGSRQEAIDELESMGESESHLEVVEGLSPTLALVELMGAHPSDIGRPSLTAVSDLAVAWAQENGLNGIWWEDTLSPESYSAPRGVIFPQYVSEVQFIPIHSQVSKNRQRFGM